MYQAAGEKWVRAGAVSHAVCLYAHDKEAQEQFFRYGFGLRCVDAIRDMDEIKSPPCDGYTFCELEKDDFIEILPLEKMLCRHFINSPTFMVKSPIDIEDFFTAEKFLKNIEGARYFIAKEDDLIVAFLCAEVTGETFIRNISGYIHLNGAFCLPEYRGKGVLQGLLSYTIETLKNDGFTKLGTDFESINPAAYGFWLKHFSAYSHGVVRRIDDSILGVDK
jgi:GNAT superfamily N-acetyltransferase